jgi:hydroxymethylpyrimidine/phosphomethylpyrimidine kinase
MKKVLTIAGSDCSGGAGIQADIKTIAAHGMYAMSVVTALTAQNTVEVAAVMEVPPDFVSLQMDAVFMDIYPDAVKVGMASNVGVVRAIAAKLREYAPRHIVADPVMVSASGYKLLSGEATRALVSELMPLAEVSTPNIPEAEALTGLKIRDVGGMERAAEAIGRVTGRAVLVKGGHMTDAARHGAANGLEGQVAAGGDGPEGGTRPDALVDVLYSGGVFTHFPARRVDNPNTHGTGCTLSSAIACGLAKGLSLEESIRAAKEYLVDALEAMLDLGRGCGPLDHMCRL